MNRPRLLALLAVSTLALAACSKGGGSSQASGAGGGPGAKPAGGPDTVITEADLPHLKAGKWQKVESDGTGKPETSTYCEAGKPIRMNKPAEEQCAKFEIKRTFLGGIVMDMQCGDPAKYEMKAHASASGDFNSHMTSDMTMSVTVPGRPPVNTTVHTDATYLGPCDAAEKARDLDN